MFTGITTVDWFSKFSDVIKTRANTASWDANKSYQTMLNIRDLRKCNYTKGNNA